MNNFSLIEEILKTFEKNYRINIPSDIVFFDLKNEMSKINDVQNKLKGVLNDTLIQEEDKLAKKIEKYNYALELSNKKNRDESLSLIEKTNEIKKRLDDNLLELERSLKIINKKEDEIFQEEVNKYYNEYLLLLKKYNKDKIEIKENYENAITYLVSATKKNQEALIREHNIKMEELRQKHAQYQKDRENSSLAFVTDIDAIKKELKVEEELYSNFYIEKMNSLNENIKIKQKESEIDKKKISNILSNKLDEIRQEKKELIQALDQERDASKKKALQTKFFHIEKQERLTLRKITNLSSLFDFSLKSTLDFLLALQDLTSLIKRFQTKDFEINASINNNTFKLKRENAELIDEKNIIIAESEIKKEKENLELELKEENRKYQKQTQDQKRIMEHNTARVDINIEIARLTFILEKLKASFYNTHNKDSQIESFNQNKDNFEIEKQRQDMILQQELSKLKRKNVDAQNNGNIIIVKSNHEKKEALFNRRKENFTLEVNEYLELFMLWQRKVKAIFNIIPTLYKNLPYMDEGYLEFVKLLRAEKDTLFKKIEYISKSLINVLSDYLEHEIKANVEREEDLFNYSVNNFILKIENIINSASEAINRELKRNYVEINKQENIIKKEKKQLSTYKKQILKLDRIKNKKTRQAKINYRFGYSKVKLGYNFARLSYNELKKKNKSLRITLNNNEHIKDLLLDSKDEARKVVTKHRRVLFTELNSAFRKVKTVVEDHLEVIRKKINILDESLIILKNYQQDSALSHKTQNAILDVLKEKDFDFKNIIKTLTLSINSINSKYMQYIKRLFRRENQITKVCQAKQNELFNSKYQSDQVLIKSFTQRSKKYRSLLDRNNYYMKKTTYESEALERKEIEDQVNVAKQLLNKQKQKNDEIAKITNKNDNSLFNANNNIHKENLKKIKQERQNKVLAIDDNIKQNEKKIENQETVLNNTVHDNYYNFIKEKDFISTRLKKKQDDVYTALLDLSAKVL